MMRHIRQSSASTCASAALVAVTMLGCGPEGGIKQQHSLRVTVTQVNGADPPTPDAALPANLGTTNEAWDFTVDAVDEKGELDPSFNGYVRISVEPGSLSAVQGGAGRNLLVENGTGQGKALVTTVWGPSRLKAEDIGYTPAPPNVVPTCANGIDDNGNGLVDYPNDPGCEFADDMTEDGGAFLSGVSPVVNYRYPTVADVQGHGSATPYPYQALRLATADPQEVYVTRVASSGFFVTDLSEQATGFNSIYAYNFSTPAFMRVCDRVTYLSGTASEFFGFTELSFPSYWVSYVWKPSGEPLTAEECPLPEPTVITGARLAQPVEMEKLEGGMGRVNNWAISKNFGPELAVNNAFGPNRSSCDFSGDGAIDYTDPLEGSCSDACTTDPECSEWYGFESRGNYKVHLNAAQILINTTTALGFDPLAHKGQVIPSVTGTLRHFSGGGLNWTIETRCIDDLVCGADPCPPAPVAPNLACITVRTQPDDDSETQ